MHIFFGKNQSCQGNWLVFSDLLVLILLKWLIYPCSGVDPVHPVDDRVLISIPVDVETGAPVGAAEQAGEALHRGAGAAAGHHLGLGVSHHHCIERLGSLHVGRFELHIFDSYRAWRSLRSTGVWSGHSPRCTPPCTACWRCSSPKPPPRSSRK